MNKNCTYEIVLTDDEKLELNNLRKQKTIDRRVYERLMAIFYILEGKTEVIIAELLSKSETWVIKWRKRFYLHRIKGLYDLPRSGRPPIFSPTG